MRNLKAFLLFTAACLLMQGCGEKYVFQLDEHIGICGTNRAEAAKACGLDYLEANVSSFLCPESDEETFAANRESVAGSLPIYSANGFFPGSLKVVGPEAETERAIRYSETAFRRASELGMKVLVLGSSGSRSIPEGFSREEAESQFLALLKGIAPAAEKYGILVAIEPLQKSETNFINTVTEGAEMARKADSPNICVLADFFHMARENEDPEDIVKAADKLVHCHIAEVEERTPPGEKGDDFTPYYRALKKIHYTGRISMECGWKDIDAQLPVAVKTMKEQINSVK
jgi:sugar phosphate isomerase/epimerase